MSDRRPIGQVLDASGLQATLRDGELVDGAVVVMRVIDSEGRSRVSMAWTDGLDFIVRRGLMEIARDVDRQEPQEEDQ